MYQVAEVHCISDGSVHPSPNDLTIARVEKCSYHDLSRNVIM